ncbi:hypothetical protein X808_18020 [Mannheimia varigena USDA-ARS-USMARC-1296]|uniref:ATPase AAA-type core domain-containing protein n=1 Tax=Mannheimia varigena USDA-ARS-USMARC-1296 TaxID=1433287 RepID=W0QDH1_9PAST|nr:ATP-binding protein [Mannheimia varigena]AHG76322.1 hypothetical protein X808_18020 [Mannheimia varigena USDA-ARS-USMARC-1296]
MKLIKLEVLGLNGSEIPIKIHFNSDFNILTGKNGSGKTTLLKLIWYVISGNISLAIGEILFKKLILETDEYLLTLENQDNDTGIINIEDSSTKEIINEKYTINTSYLASLRRNEKTIKYFKEKGSSIFLPTFRRIEGGFSTEKGRKRKLEESLSELSNELSNENHLFISSLSTVDIEALLIKKHSELSEQYGKLHQEISSEIINDIKNLEEKYSSREELSALVSTIKEKVQQMENDRANIMHPFDILKELVRKIFNYSGIKLDFQGANLGFGNAANAINSGLLSAGEKQMLSFIAYNTFYQNSIFIIDEPELSLHIDWQRVLFPMLLSQENNNQFIISTHSPFIYSKYPDKELQIASDKGFND